MKEIKIEPLVSIITPLYNAEKFIGETIESVISQTYNNWEMLIIDDASKDSSLNISSSYEQKDNRIKVIKNYENLGVIKSRNRGIKKAKGKYIAFLDADDLWKNNKLKKQIKFMEENQIAISYTGYEKINEDGSFRGKLWTPKRLSYKDSLKGNLMGCLTVVYNIEKIGKKYFKEIKMSEDHLLWLEILKEEVVACGLEESLAQYRVIKNSRSKNKFNAIKTQWKINREIEKLGFFKSLYYFINYLWYGYKRYKV